MSALKRRNPIPEALNSIGSDIVDAALTVHRALGPGLLESVYEEALCHELRSRGRKVERQVHRPVVYKGVVLDAHYRIDLLVDDEVIVEVKATTGIDPVHEAQLLTYLRTGHVALGYLLNFNVPLMKEGIRRRINTAAIANRQT